MPKMPEAGLLSAPTPGDDRLLFAVGAELIQFIAAYPRTIDSKKGAREQSD